MSKLTIVILTQDNENTIERTLKSVQNIGFTIVVDGGSSDRTEEICRRFELDFIKNSLSKLRVYKLYCVV